MTTSAIAKENDKIIKCKHYLFGRNKISIKAQYTHRRYNDVKPWKKWKLNADIDHKHEPKIIVAKSDTFNAISMFPCKSPVVLDFASDSNPGGGFRTKQQGTQEESLCRRSDLGIILEKVKYPIGDKEAIYIPKVQIFRDDKYNLLPQPQSVAVIASSMRSVSVGSIDRLRDKISSVFAIAQENDHDLIVLGSWGCGAFKESPDDIIVLTNEFKTICDSGFVTIPTVVFATLGKVNYNAFLKTFQASPS